MNIAICDDEVLTTRNLENYIESALEETTYDCSCKNFFSGDSLLVFLKENPQYFQIYLLDIEMSGTNGLETASQIRRYDSDAVIIFVTGHVELMPEAFRVLAFNYIIKPFNRITIKETILSAINLLESRNKLFSYKIQKTIHTVYRSQIEYIESFGRRMVLHLTDGGEIEYNGTLKDAAAKTEGLTFAQAHNSYIVNMERIAKIDSQHLRMRGGAEIPISGKFHVSFHASYRNYILMKRG